MKQNQKAVVIKSFPNGISLYLADNVPFEELLAETAYKFKESDNFFKDAKIALSFEGRKLTDEEERQMIGIISENSRVTIVCIIGKDGERNQPYLRALTQMSYHDEKCKGQFYRGTLKSGQTLETEHSIVILGDVNPGCSVISTKDIIIIGGLYGEAYAGGNGDQDHFVVALEMSPERLRIGDLHMRKEKQSKWSIKPKYAPKIAHIKGGVIVTEQITKESLSNFTI